MIGPGGIERERAEAREAERFEAAPFVQPGRHARQRVVGRAGRDREAVDDVAPAREHRDAFGAAKLDPGDEGIGSHRAGRSGRSDGMALTPHQPFGGECALVELDTPPNGARPLFSRPALLRIVLDLVADELAASRGRSAASLGRSGWDETTRLGGDGLDLDSLELMNASSALSEYFHLHEYGAEDYLLQLPTVGEWCDLVAQSLAATGTHLTFRTGGSTGAPKRCTHAVADLSVEVAAWTALLGPVERIVSLVPAHHIYGTVWTALLPDRLGVECVSAGAAAVGRAGPGTLVVGTPTHWAYVSRSLPAFPPGVTGVSSTAPLPAQLAHQLRGQGLEHLVEVYGSSETGGIGYRSDSAAPFTLLNHWDRDGEAALSRASAGGAATVHALMDEADWLDARRFVVRGRRDGAVQIGGRNVFPERVRDKLLEHVEVAEATVRLEPATGRLKAFVVPVVDGVDEGLADRLDAWCGEQLSDVERPRRFAVGAALPRNAMGKLADW